MLLQVLTSLLSVAAALHDLAVQVPDGTVTVHKCCGPEELMDYQHRCIHVNHTDSTPWEPVFSNELGEHNIQIAFRTVSGFPGCGSKQQWPVYHYHDSTDRLVLLPGGLLRHYTHYEEKDPDDPEVGVTQSALLPSGEKRYYDYDEGSYCLDKVLINLDKFTTTEAQGAVLCVPEVKTAWADTDFIVRKIVDPILHGISIICLAAVAVVYFVLPPLRDLPGNMLSTLAVCLAVVQAADLVRIFTELASHVSFIIADVMMYLSILAAFFWLNAFGYYIWKTFRSRNVFLRVTDRRKYCYYSSYAWGCTLGMTTLAVGAHFMFDMGNAMPFTPHGQETIGWLGIAVFFSPIAFTIIIDIFFYLATGQTIARMSTYGRIHNKMKFSFEMFIKLFLVMSTAWLFFLLSWLRYPSLVYTHIVTNALQAPLFLWITVLGQKRVMYLLKKTCCYRDCLCPCCRPEDDAPSDWGEEMLAMNANYNY